MIVCLPVRNRRHRHSVLLAASDEHIDSPVRGFVGNQNPARLGNNVSPNGAPTFDVHKNCSIVQSILIASLGLKITTSNPLSM